MDMTDVVSPLFVGVSVGAQYDIALFGPTLGRMDWDGKSYSTLAEYPD